MIALLSDLSPDDRGVLYIVSEKQKAALSERVPPEMPPQERETIA